jgi:GH35 family endo-1,4-beta-xylanase
VFRFSRIRGFLGVAFASLFLSTSLSSCVKRGEGRAAPAAANPNDNTAMTTNPDSLRALAKAKQRHVGVALATWHFSDARYQATARAEFDSLTAENEMKWQTVEPQPGSFAFEAGDKLVAFAEEVAKQRGFTQMFLLSTQAFRFFEEKMGYAETTPEALPAVRRPIRV